MNKLDNKNNDKRSTWIKRIYETKMIKEKVETTENVTMNENGNRENTKKK